MNIRKFICTVIAAAMLAGCVLSMNGCTKQEEGKTAESTTVAEKSNRVDADLHDVVNAVETNGGFDKSLVSDFVYKEDDTDEESLMFIYGVVDLNANKYIKDYVLTLATDYNQTFAVFVFEDGVTDAEYEEVKKVVSEEYIKLRAESLKMYMPEEYDIVSWALENPDLIWRQYDNALVLIIDGKGEAKADFEAFEAAALK